MDKVSTQGTLEKNEYYINTRILKCWLIIYSNENWLYHAKIELGVKGPTHDFLLKFHIIFLFKTVYLCILNNWLIFECWKPSYKRDAKVKNHSYINIPRVLFSNNTTETTLSVTK